MEDSESYSPAMTIASVVAVYTRRWIDWIKCIFRSYWETPTQNSASRKIIKQHTAVDFYTKIHLLTPPPPPPPPPSNVFRIGSALVQIMACRLFGPRPYLNQCWFRVNWTLRNILQWNFNQHIKISIHKNASENIVCDLAAILFRGRGVNCCYLTLPIQVCVPSTSYVM